MALATARNSLPSEAKKSYGVEIKALARHGMGTHTGERVFTWTDREGTAILGRKQLTGTQWHARRH